MSDLFAIDVGLDFIGAVTAHVEARLKEAEHITVLFPNRRALRFFEHRLSPSLLLRVKAAALEDFARDAVHAFSDPPPVYQLDIDRYLMIHDIVQAHPTLYQGLGGRMEHVFPWCVHLSNLLDELDQHLVTSVTPLDYIDEVVKEAREILKNLDTLFTDYRRVMKGENLTYRGDIFRRLNSLKDRLDGPFVLAGFSLLTTSQEVLFTHLFRHADTSVLFHTDLKGRHPVSNPYRLYDQWMDGSFWGKEPKRIEGSDADSPNITFYESFDTHAEASQVRDVVRPLTEDGAPASPLGIGIVLPDSRALFPVLFALPGDLNAETPMNVTLGFPFERSVFHRLLSALTELTLTRHPERGFYHTPLLELLSHPFIQSMTIEGVPFRETALTLQEGIISHNLTFVRFADLKPDAGLSEGHLHRCLSLYDEVIAPFVSARSLRDMGQVLTRLIRSFSEALSEKETYDLERQMIQNFLDRVLPNLTLSRSADREIATPQVLCRVLMHLVAPLAIPFEGNPLKGIQVMGMLESRLLNFTHLLILDVNEGILPQGVKVDPLLPPSLAPLVGLPSPNMREALFWYTFFRLVDGSKDVHVFYQRGVTADEKRIRSRFVEQLLLEAEMALADDKDEEIRDLEASLIRTYRFHIPAPGRPDTARPPFYDARLEACLSDGVSPSMLDDYLTCPHRFYLKRILKMAERGGLEASQAATDVGKMVHGILDTVFKTVLDRPLTLPLLEEMKQAALARVERSVETAFPTLSPLRRELLKQVTTTRLTGFFSHTEEEVSKLQRIRVIETEKTFSTSFEGYTLKGRIDRIDEIMDAPGDSAWLRIIDYKTGTSANPPGRKLPGFLETFDFSDYSMEALTSLKKVLRSTQLPIYLYLVGEALGSHEGQRIAAVLLYLGKPKGEIQSDPLGNDTLSMDEIAAVIRYLINHMRFNGEIAPVDLSVCKSCPYKTVCRMTGGTV